jgi:hypothetical protein
MLYFIYCISFNKYKYEYFKHAAHSPFFSSKCRLFHNVAFFGSCIIHILRTGVLKFKCKICAVFVVGPASRPAQPRTQHKYHHKTKVKPEAATAVIELLMMGGKTPETCWAVNRCQDNKLKNCCIRLVIYLN